MGTFKKLGEKRSAEIGFDTYEQSIATRSPEEKPGRYHAYHNNNTLCGIFIEGIGWWFRPGKVNCPKCLDMIRIVNAKETT
jgi:hypothetical protein